MLSLSIIRRKVAERFALDKYALSAITAEMSRFVQDEQDLTASRIEGSVMAFFRHKRTDYESVLQAAPVQYYGGGYKDTKQATNDVLRAKISLLRRIKL